MQTTLLAKTVGATEHEMDEVVAHIDVIPTGGPLGAEVKGVDLSGVLSDALIAFIRSVWLRHHVIYFRDQNLTDNAASTLDRIAIQKLHQCDIAKHWSVQCRFYCGHRLIVGASAVIAEAPNTIARRRRPRSLVPIAQTRAG